jgi:hypothetical protein
MLLEVLCVVFLTLLAVIHINNYNNQWVQILLVLVNLLGKGRTNTQKMGIFRLLTSPLELQEGLLLIGALGMVLLHLGKEEIASSRARKEGFLDESQT